MCGKKPERVCQDTVHSHMGNGHAVLITILLCRADIRKFQMIVEQFPKDLEGSRRNKRELNNVKAEQVINLFYITFVILLH